jgi:hypothetical protein
MLKIEINVRTKQDAHIIAMGTTEDILFELSIIAGALTRELMQPFAAKDPASMVKAMITGALLADLMGHSDVNTTMIYLRMTEERHIAIPLQTTCC